MILQAVVGGFVLDALFGDPAWLPHPVVLMGRCISRLEKFLRARLPGTPQGELLGGAVTAFCLPVGTFLITSLVCLAAAELSPWLGLAVQMFWCGQALAAKGLAQESTNVYAQLKKNDLPAARKAVSRIVGRDTQNLTAEGVTKAAVETVAENASDGVIAPLLYMLIGGAPLALTYKAINTMDSMLGYKNEKYLYFGRAAAKLDDVANYIPPQGELLGGAVTAFCLPVGTFLITSLVCLAAAELSPWLGLAVQMFWCGQALAAKGLAQESTNVYAQLKKNDLPAARKAVSRIVGRDTQNLTAEGVTKAAVETVAENASDGVIAPLLYMLIGGAPLALTYKAINTMDSMLGYKNEKYLYFGRAAAKLDDVANYIPSRLAALLWVAAAAFTGNDAKGAWRIWRRDRHCHASPNSAQTESACAGALGVQLAGPAYYFGEYYPKPTIGDALRPIEPQDILRANRMMYVASGFALAWGAAIRGFLA